MIIVIKQRRHSIKEAFISAPGFNKFHFNYLYNYILSYHAQDNLEAAEPPTPLTVLTAAPKKTLPVQAASTIHVEITGVLMIPASTVMYAINK